MSASKPTFTPKQIEELKTQFRGPAPVAVASAVELSEPKKFFPFDISKRDVGVILGIGASAVGAFFGARYLLSRSTSEVLNHSGEFGLSRQASGIGSFSDRSESLKKTIKVTLHQCPRGYNTPCISPFSLKLETFLRVANIPYEVKYTAQPHAKNSPWLTVGDHDITDAHECITFLCNSFEINLERGAKPSRLTASRLVGIQLDNHIYWGIALWRWVYDKGTSLKDIQPLSPQALNVISSVSESVRRAAWYHGLGRLPYEKVLEIITTDLADLSAALGRHLHFMGERPGEVDCNAFAMLAQMLWNMPSSPFEKELLKYDNLVEFVHRMRDNYWPDWQELLHKPGDSKVPEKFYYPTSEFHMSMTGLKGMDEPEASSTTFEANETANGNESASTTPNFQSSLRARSMPVKSNDPKGLQNTSDKKVSAERLQPPPIVPSRLISSTASRPPPSGIAPQFEPKHPMNQTARAPMQQPETNKMATISQAQLKSIQTMLNDLNKQLGFANNETQNQQNFYNNNNNYAATPPYGPGYDSQAQIPPQGGRPTAAYPYYQPPQQAQPGPFNPQQAPIYYPNNVAPNPYYPNPPNGYYPSQP